MKGTQLAPHATHLMADTGHTIAAMAHQIGVDAQVLRQWLVMERSWMEVPSTELDADRRAEVEWLRRGNVELRMDHRFLIRAVAFVAVWLRPW